MHATWTAARIAELTRLWVEEGWPASAIARHLANEHFDISRNAVIGKARRLGLPARPSPIRKIA